MLVAQPLLGLYRTKPLEAEKALFLKGVRKTAISHCHSSCLFYRKLRKSSALLFVPEIFVCAFKACSLCELQTCLNNLGGLTHYSSVCVRMCACMHIYGVFIHLS